MAKNPNILIYEKAVSDYGMRLMAALRESLDQAQFKFCTTIEDLRAKLQAPQDTSSALILMLSDEQDLADIIHDQLLLDNSLPTILILPDRTTGLEMAGHKLRPRFLDYKDSDPTEAATVLANIVKAGRDSKGSQLKEVSHGA